MPNVTAPERVNRQESQMVAIAPVVEPSKSEAAKVLLRFSKYVLAGDMAAAKQDLRVDESYNDIQVNAFLKELNKPSHINAEGVAAIVVEGFGTLAQQFGKHANALATYHKLPVEEAYAFGGEESGAILHWDGKQFRVVAIHKLGSR